MAVNKTGPFPTRYDISDQNVSNRTGRRLLFLGQLRADLASTPNIEMDGIPVSPPEPVEVRAFNDQIGEHDVTHITSVEDHERNTAVGAGDHAVVDRHLAYTVHVAIAEFKSAGGRRKAAIGDGDILAGKWRTPYVRGIENNSVIAGFNGAVGDADILTAVRVNPICPDTFL